MSAQKNLSPKQFHFVVEPYGDTQRTGHFEGKPGAARYYESDDPVSHRMTVYQGTRKLGRIHWGIKDGDVTLTTMPEYRRQGVATRLFDRASEYSAENGLTMPSLETSFAVSPEGALTLEALKKRKGTPHMRGQQPLIPRKGKNKTEVRDVGAG